MVWGAPVEQQPRDVTEKRLWFHMSGTPLYFSWVLAAGSWPAIWFRLCFYKEPIGTGLRARAPGATHKARERQALARTGPAPIFKILRYS